MGRTDLRPDITKEVLEEYIRKGYSQNRIAITLGTTQSTIFNKLKKYGLQVQKTRPSNYDEKALIKQLQNGWTTEQIARYFGVCTGTVGSWISKNKLGKYRKASPKKFDTKLCSTCIYGTGKKTDMDRCNYLSITGHSRNKGQPEDVCSKYVKNANGRKKEEKSMSDGVTLVQHEDGAFGAYDDTYDIAIHCKSKEEQKKVIERLSTDWIPVTERFPEEDGRYLVTFKYGIKVCMVGYGSCKRTVLGYPIGHGWYNLEEAQYYAEDSIIAWMHLPEPYKED